MITKQEELFLEALMTLQMCFKDKKGRFPTSQENVKLVEEAEKIAGGAIWKG